MDRVDLLEAAVGEPAREILRRAESYEAAVVGLEASLLRRVGVRTPAEQVAGRWPGALVMVKASRGLRDLAKRWL